MSLLFVVVLRLFAKNSGRMQYILAWFYLVRLLMVLTGLVDNFVMIIISPICSGHLDDQSKPILFSMARLDQVKNITGLVEAYAKCGKLRELVNLVVVAGYNDVNKSKDREEIAEIEKMHELIKTYNLYGQFRWISAQTNRARNGELYRYIADTHGAFVQVYL
jgi:glycosyltransferase involved in cell wall biosynthesis